MDEKLRKNGTRVDLAAFPLPRPRSRPPVALRLLSDILGREAKKVETHCCRLINHYEYIIYW